MNLNLHRTETVIVHPIETITHDDGRVVYLRRITIKNGDFNHLGSFEINMFAKEINNLDIKEKE
jgi:hypothetical protein